MNVNPFSAEISRYIWDTKYRYRHEGVVQDRHITDTWRRVADAIAAAEEKEIQKWQDSFYTVLDGFKFLPGGRIQAGAGTDRKVTLFNCFVMGTIEDSMDGIFHALQESALTMQRGGGIGCDFSSLRPRGTRAREVGGIASGPVSFMRIWNTMCSTLLSTGNRRGAMMATLRCDHPDIEDFIDAKQDPQALRNFNLSVLITDSFMRAIAQNEDWPLVFPETEADRRSSSDSLMRTWPGFDAPVRCKVYRRVPAAALWQRIMRAAYDYAEPGVLFIDRINRSNNLWYGEHIVATNPCGEVPLPPYGACNLGSINLTSFVREPFSRRAWFDTENFTQVAAVATRMMDDVISISHYPLASQAKQAQGTRRIGLGITGLADALIMLGHIYGSHSSLRFTQTVFRDLCHTAYSTSIKLAEEKGPFPYFEQQRYVEGEFIRALPYQIQEKIESSGIRNSHLIAVAPTGTISLLANNVSSSIEPIFGYLHKRTVLDETHGPQEFELVDYSYGAWQKLKGVDAPLPAQFVDARSLDPDIHLTMQAAIQPYVDNAISKTINIPAEYEFDSFQTVYQRAYDMGLKGCTTFRPNPITGEVLTALDDIQARHCCSINREAD